ncbi:Hypothetical protein NTJ_15389 [Nesidiocoris tenuis]|uniref:Peptidase S1 domain-containing protein n=1 Tax=Nesidiocoris tenuis TaxID=355587 RepID=A0ABN7BH23_9HEMI|nr:Hypothetical protein NTJ_15389 [Nesidiocoris tenuis]
MAVEHSGKLLLIFGLVVNVLGNNDSKVIGGQLSRVIPFMVSVQQHARHHCGGSLVSLSNVLLACHCFSGFNQFQKLVNVTDPKVFRVVAGHTDLETTSKNQQIREVKSLLKHPRCSWWGGNDIPKFDLALIVTKSAFKTTANVKPIGLYSKSKKSFEERIAQITEKTICWSAGWGMTAKVGVGTSRYLKYLVMRFVPYSKCKTSLTPIDARFKTFNMIKNGQICFQGAYKSEAVYGGDSGGPLVCESQLIGVTSFVLNSTNDIPTVFAKVSEFTEWYGGIAHRSVDSSAPVPQIGLVFLVMINLVEIETL